MSDKSATRKTLGEQILAGLGSAGYLALDTLFRLLPEPTGYRLARVVGGMLRPPGLRKPMRDMMKAVLGNPGWTKARWQELLEGHLRWVGRMSIENSYWLRLPVHELRRRVTVRGQEHLAEALKSGRGAMLFANHLGNFMSFVVRSACWAPEVCAFGNPMPTPVIERPFQEFHRRLNVTRWLVGQGLSFRAEDVLRRNGLVVTFIDLTTVKRNNVWVRFGHAETLVNLGPALLALRHDVEALCLTFMPLHGLHHQITIHPPLTRDRSGDIEADALQLTQRALDLVTEELFRRPEQWWQWNAVRFRDGRS